MLLPLLLPATAMRDDLSLWNISEKNSSSSSHRKSLSRRAHLTTGIAADRFRPSLTSTLMSLKGPLPSQQREVPSTSKSRSFTRTSRQSTRSSPDSLRCLTDRVLKHRPQRLSRLSRRMQLRLPSPRLCLRTTSMHIRHRRTIRIDLALHRWPDALPPTRSLSVRTERQRLLKVICMEQTLLRMSEMWYVTLIKLKFMSSAHTTWVRALQIGRPGTSGGPPARGSQTDHSHNRGPLGPLPYPSSSSTSGSMPYPSSSTSGPTFSTPPVAFPPTALSKFSPPPISYSTPQAPYDSANSSFSSMHGSMPPALSPNSSFSNHLNGSPYTMPTTTSSSSSPSSNISRSAMAPISYPNVGPSSQQTSGTDLRRPPLAAQPNSFTRGSSYYDQQPQNRRLSQLHYSPSGPTGSPQWLDGTVGITGLKNLGNSQSQSRHL